jgi:hypothetical protein
MEPIRVVVWDSIGNVLLGVRPWERWPPATRARLLAEDPDAAAHVWWDIRLNVAKVACEGNEGVTGARPAYTVVVEAHRASDVALHSIAASAGSVACVPSRPNRTTWCGMGRWSHTWPPTSSAASVRPASPRWH